MKIGAIPEGFLEWVSKRLNLVPTPVVDTLQAAALARSVMVGTKLGVFEVLGEGPLTAGEIARRLDTDARATEKLLGALVVSDYLRFRRGRYSLTRVARKWLLRSSPLSLYDNMLHRFLEWQGIEQFEDFVRTGKPLHVHGVFQPEQWAVYQRGMRSLAAFSAPEIARRMPVPPDARAMLDVGGAHGLYSVAVCRRHPQLKATVLDLPEAVEHAAPLLDEEGMGDRVVHWAGNVLEDDLGENTWDLVLASQIVHHFDESTNRELVRRIGRALRPGGVFAIMEIVRPTAPGAAGQMGGLLDLLFAVTSESGTWPSETLIAWQADAGLLPRKPIRLVSAPGAHIQAATKPGADKAS